MKRIVLNKSTTSKDVAKLAGVSQSTVSRVFSSADGCGVKLAAKERVLQAAKELGYRPNLLARGMSSGKSNIVGLVIGDNIGPFYNHIINMFIKKIQGIGMQCLVFKVPRQGQMDSIIEKVIQFQVDAVVITASAMTKVMAETIIDNEIPIILFNRYISGVAANMVYMDFVESSELVAELLYKKGHKNIGMIKFELDTAEEVEKKVGFCSKLRQYGIHHIKEETAMYTYKSGYEAGVRLLSVKEPPTAIYCTSDLIAIGVIDAAKMEFGLRIPEDLAVVGFDDVDMAGWKAYNLTTIRQPVDEMVNITIDILKIMLSANDTVNRGTEVTLVRPILIERGTV